MTDDDFECCGPDGKPFSAHKNSVDKAWAMRTIERLRAERDARVTELLESNNALLDRARRAEAKRDALAEALRALVDLDERSGWHSKQQDAARAALAEYDAGSREGGAQKEQ